MIKAICTIGLLLFSLSVRSQNKGAITSTNNTPYDTMVPNPETFHFSVSPAHDWTSLLKRKAGWFGGDGIFSVSLNGKDAIGAANDSTKTLFWFSDTMIGDIVNDSLQPGSKMIHNSVAILKGDRPDEQNIKFYWDKDEQGNPKSVFIPNTPASVDSEWYWLGDGFVNRQKDGDIYIFAYRIKKANVSDGFGFALAGTTLIILPHDSKPPFKEQQQMDTPLFVAGDKPDNGYAFGAGVFVNTKAAGAPHPDGYVYVYGVKNGTGFMEKDLMVARVLPENMTDFSKWRFWDGKGWNLDVRHIRQAATITDHVSDELSLTPLSDGRYALVFQNDGIGSFVGLRLAESPHGPFGPVIKLWDCPEVNKGKDFYTYNAKAHPHLSKKGEILISYNVNAFHFFKNLNKVPYLYRPRFIKVKLK